MNLISYILLGIVIALFVFVARYVAKGKGKKSCCEKCEGCSGC